MLHARWPEKKIGILDGSRFRVAVSGEGCKPDNPGPKVPGFQPRVEQGRSPTRNPGLFKIRTCGPALFRIPQGVRGPCCRRLWRR